MDLPLPDLVQREVLKLLVAAVGMPVVAIFCLYVRSSVRKKSGAAPPRPTFRRRLGMVMAGLVGIAWLAGGAILALKVRGTAEMFWQLDAGHVSELRFYAWDAPQSIDDAIAAEPIAVVSDDDVITHGFSLADGALPYKRKIEPPEVLERGLIIEIVLDAQPTDEIQRLFLRIVDRTSRDAGPKAIVEPYTSTTMRTSLGLYEDDNLVQWARNIAPHPAPAVEDDAAPPAEATGDAGAEPPADIAPAEPLDENSAGPPQP